MSYGRRWRSAGRPHRSFYTGSVKITLKIAWVCPPTALKD